MVLQENPTMSDSTIGKNRLRVVELFAGVGGFRLGLQGWAGKSALSGYRMPLRGRGEGGYDVVWSNQWEPSTKRQHANEVYEARWPNANHCGDDLGTVSTEDIPDHDLLVGGFPCQDYSVATTLKNSKGLRGKKGVLWWQIERILREKGDRAPRYLFLENVDRLLKSPSSQRGRDFAIMLASLSDLGYAVEWRVVNAADYGMPQRRRRIFFMGYKKGTPEYEMLHRDQGQQASFEEGVMGQAFPTQPVHPGSVLAGQLEGSLEELSKSFNAEKRSAVSPFQKAGVMVHRIYWTTNVIPEWYGGFATMGDILQPNKEVDASFKIDQESLERWAYLKGSKREPRTNKALGYTYMFSEGALAFPDPIDRPSRTIITGEGGASPSRTKHAVKQGRTLRRLTPIELERLNMFPDNHTSLEGVSDGRRAFFMGNALVVGIIERVGSALLSSITEHREDVPLKEQV